MDLGCNSEDDLHELSSYISSNSLLSVVVLKVSNIYMEFEYYSALWLSLFDSIRNAKYLDSIKVHNVIRGDAVMESFSNWIMSTQSLKILKVSGCSGITSFGLQSFATAIASLDNLEEIYIKIIGYRGIDANSGTILLIDIIAKQSLKIVRLALTTFAQLQLIANMIA
jgi:hypothetical protein